MSEEQQPVGDSNEIVEEKPIPEPPAGIDDPDRLSGGQERWTECPLRDCKRDAELLYQDFYLRDIRTERLMCTACAVRTEVGYLAREVVKASDDRFFQGTNNDYLVTFFAMLGASFGLNLILTLLPIGGIFLWFIAAAVGSAVGVAIAQQTRRLTGGRVGRRSAEVAVGGLIVGALLAPLGWFVLNFGLVGLRIFTALFTDPFIYFSPLGLDGVIFTGAMGIAVWGIFKRRI